MVDKYVLSLRPKLEQDPKNPRLIQAVYGIGYCFILGGERKAYRFHQGFPSCRP